MRVTCCAALAMGVILFAGCGDKVTNNYYQSESFSIVGRLTPPDSGSVTATGPDTLSAPINSQGFFLIGNVPPGIYHLSVHPAHHTRREMDGIVVFPSKTPTLEIPISSYPYPIYQTAPSDGDRQIPSYAGIALFTDEPLDLNDLNARTAIEPHLPGRWVDSLFFDTNSNVIEFVRNRLANVWYRLDSGLRVGVTYRLTIPRLVHTRTGATLGSDCVFAFSTEPFTVNVYLPPQSRLGGVSLWDFQPALSFNGCIEADSLAGAVSFAPAIEGIWATYYGCFNYGDGDLAGPAGVRDAAEYSEEFRFLPITGVPLLPETQYTMVVDTLRLSNDGLRLGAPVTTQFVTERPGVVSVIPRHGTIVPFTNFTVLLDFNVPMDTASVDSAFELGEVGAWIVPGKFTWASERSLQFGPLDQFRSGSAYRVYVSTAARTKDGKNLLRSFVSYFRVQ